MAGGGAHEGRAAPDARMPAASPGLHTPQHPSRRGDEAIHSCWAAARPLRRPLPRLRAQQTVATRRPAQPQTG